MDVEGIFTFEPQTADFKSGPEPHMYDLILYYYSSHGCTAIEATKFANDYVQQIEKEFF